MEERVITGLPGVSITEWDNYVKSHPEGNLFQSPGMYYTYLATRDWEPVVLFARDIHGELKGVLLSVIQREHGILVRAVTARAVIFGGPLADDHDTLTALLATYRTRIKGRAIYTQVRNFRTPGDDIKALFKAEAFSYEEHLNIRVDLTVSQQEFWKGIKQNRKAGINKARKQGFRFYVTREERVIEPFHELLRSTYKVNGLPYPDISFFRSLSRHLPDELLWFVLEKDGIPGIILASFISGGTLYIFYPGIDQSPAFLRMRPVDLFYYEVMRWGQDNGVRMLDWMGAGKPGKEYGVRYFKQQYGGELFSPGRFEAVHRPLLMMTGRAGVALLKLVKGNK